MGKLLTRGDLSRIALSACQNAPGISVSSDVDEELITPLEVMALWMEAEFKKF